MTISEKLQNIMDKCNEAEKCSNTERIPTFCTRTCGFLNKKKREPIISSNFIKLWNRCHQHLSRLKELFLLLAYSSLNFAADWMIWATIPFVEIKFYHLISWSYCLRKKWQVIYCGQKFMMAVVNFV